MWERKVIPGWLKRLKMGDKIAFEQLVKETRNMVYGIVFSHVHEANTAEDLAQDTYIKAYTHLNGLKHPEKIKAWLSSIAHHTAIDWIRKKKELPRDPEKLDVETKQPAHNEIVWDALELLKPHERKIIVLRYIEELSYKEIATTLKMTVTTVGVTLLRLRQRLEELLKENFK